MDDTAASRACHAPWTSLHLDPRGWVTGCTVNKRDPLGHVADSSLVELWRGRPGREFRHRFAGGGLAPGCGFCRWQRDTAGAETMYARTYDHLAPDEDPDWPAHIEFTLSTECNLACTMCSGAFSSTIRRRREGLPLLSSPYDDSFFDQLPPILEHLRTAKFLGGEPFLSRENLRIWTLMSDAPGSTSCHVTTNGTIFTARVSEVLDTLPMSIAVSMDGITAPTVERIRQGARLADILTNLDRFQAHVERHGTDLSLTFCLMTENWSEFPDFLAFAEDRGLSVYVNTVVSPVRFSLYHLPTPRLAEVVAGLEQHSSRMESLLDRNLLVWRDQVDRLRHAVLDPVDQLEAPVHLPALRRPPRTPVAAPRGADDAEADLASWGDTAAIGRFHVDPGGRVTDLDTSALVDIHLDLMAGHGIDELFLWLQSAFGRLDTSRYLVHAEDSGDRVLSFEGSDSRTEVRLISGRRSDGGAWWRLATRATPRIPAPR